MPTETRDNRGRFLPGVVNQAPGRPRRNPEVRLRSVFDEVLTRDELREIVRAHIDRGKAGSVASARLILEYAIGKLKPDFHMKKLQCSRPTCAPRMIITPGCYPLQT